MAQMYIDKDQSSVAGHLCLGNALRKQNNLEGALQAYNSGLQNNKTNLKTSAVAMQTKEDIQLAKREVEKQIEIQAAAKQMNATTETNKGGKKKIMVETGSPPAATKQMNATMGNKKENTEKIMVG